MNNPKFIDNFFRDNTVETGYKQIDQAPKFFAYTVEPGYKSSPVIREIFRIPLHALVSEFDFT